MDDEKFHEPDFKKVFEGGPSLHLILDRRLHIVGASDAWLRATGVRREDVIGRYVFAALPDNPDDPTADSVANSLASFNRVLRTGETDAMGLQRHDVQRPEPEGGFEEHYWSAINYPILDPDGSVAYILHKVEDATEFVRLKRERARKDELTEELREHNLQLEADIYVRSREAAETSQKLKQANEELALLYEKSKELDTLKSHLFANVSHELRTPLTLILGSVDRLLKEGKLDSEARHDLTVMQRNARLLHRHVDDLLDIAKLEAGRMRMQYTRTNMAALVRLAASNFETLAADRKIRFAVHTPAELAAEVDGEKVERILINLLANAFKFTPDGGAIAISLEERSEHGLLTVQDTGPGVPEHLREAIFERFRQGEGGMSRRHGGTGLGLAIVREFTSLHRGEVTVTDALGGGARFKLELPLSAPPGTPMAVETAPPETGVALQALDELKQDQAASPVSPGQNRAPRILIVEDNPDMNAFLARILGQQYWLIRAFDGAEGLERALADPPDLILADVMMPGMSGDRMVAELRRHPSLDDVPIVMLTAKADDDLRIKLLRHGVQDYLHKPFLAEEVLARVDGLLAERQRSMQQLRRSEERYRLLFERISEGFMVGEIVVDDAGKAIDFRCLAVNPAFERLFGVQVADLDGKTGRELPATVEDGVLELYARAALTGEAGHVEVEFASLGRVFVLYAFRTQPGQFGVLFVDITERKRAEEQLKTLNDELERRIELRTQELQESQLHVLHTEKLAAMGKLSAAFAHEFNNPLQSVMAVLQNFNRWLLLEGQDKALLEMALNESKRMKDLILTLQDFSQPTAGRKVLMDVHASLDSVLLLYTSDFQRKHVDTVLQYADDLPKIQAVPDQIKQVFFNLLDNAMDACSPHGGEITVRTWQEEQKVAIVIQDTGVGIDPEKLGLIFQPFYSTKSEVKGTGLGLSVCHGIVRNHQGEIRVESRMGQGSTFTVVLPVKAR